MQTKQCKCKNGSEQEKYSKIQEIIEKYKEREGSLIQVLHLAQGVYGYLPSELQEYIAKGLKIPLTDVYGVVTFYSMFSTLPRGEFTIRACMGTACYVKGALEVIAAIEKRLGIRVEETTPDSKFTLEVTRCIGACGLAPVITINDKVFQKVDPEGLDKVFEEYDKAEVEQ